MENKLNIKTQYISDKDEQREMFDYLEGLSPNISVDDSGVIIEQK